MTSVQPLVTIIITCMQKGVCNNMVTYTPHICLDLEIGGSTYTLSEGAIVYGLTYIDKGVEKCLTGAVRVINSSQNKVTVKQTCPPESYFEKTVTCQSIIIDSSDTYNAILTTVPIASIIAIDHVENDRHDNGGAEGIPIVDDVSDIDPDDLYANMTVFDRIEEE